jgi:hypothetical protein
MKIVCIDNSDSDHQLLTISLTKGKVYDSICASQGMGPDSIHYTLIGDNGNKYEYLKRRFTTLDLYRNTQIDKLCTNSNLQ